MALSGCDPNSFSNPDNIPITHVHLSLTVSFNDKILDGFVDLSLRKARENASTLILDTRDLNIKKVQYNGTDLEFLLGEPTKAFGQKLEISLPSSTELDLKIRVYYATSPNSTALQWLNPEQTAGKEHPYLFSQCQAIHARSLLPCQDTPSIKASYTAEINVPRDLVALMSAVKKETQNVAGTDSIVCNTFEQKVPIPSYLIAIVVGALESRDIGPRSKVWSEKSMVDAAREEFAETETMLKTAEALAGPYVWGVYDLLVLPPSFPYGGMENPCLTFVTPTLLAGDRSLATVVAHEITHSWTGNLVTNKTWEHFWLNEGHTVFLERKIGGRMAKDGEKFRQFMALGGWNDLKDTVSVFGPTHAYTHLVPDLRGVDPDDAFSRIPYEKGSNLLMHIEEKVGGPGKGPVYEQFTLDHPYTHLIPDLTGVDPDDVFSSVPYEKGSSLLMFLEQKLGGPEVFEPFLKSYIDTFKYKSITTDDWKQYLYEYFADKKSILDEVDWQAWFHAPGMPPVQPRFDETLRNACKELSTRWAHATDSDLDQFTSRDLENMMSQQVIQFLAELLEQDALSQSKIERLNFAYKLDDVKNSEIRFKWLRLCIKARCMSAIDKALVFVTEQGRMKFVRPIYRDLYQWEEVGRSRAIENYQNHRASMHNLTASMVGKDLQIIQ